MFKQFFVFVVCIIAMMIGNSMQQIPGVGGDFGNFANVPAQAFGAGVVAAETAAQAGIGAAQLAAAVPLGAAKNFG